MKYLLRIMLALVTVVLVVGILAPYVDADSFRGPIQNALEQTLGRSVQIGKVRFSLFSGPGFTLENVSIAEDPHYGLEPFAFVPSLEVRVRLDKLLIRQIRPLSLRLMDASVNLVKSDDGTWNAVALVERLGAPRRSPLNFFPVVSMSNGRVDFKLGARKTTLYLTETDVSVYPETSGKIYFKFEASPARTDRAGNGFGHFTGNANWYLKPAAESGNQLEADVTLEPSNISEITTLVQGQDLGVHGNMSGHMTISGPFANLQAQGELRLDDVHRWDLLPSPGDQWRVHYRALIDLEKHNLDLTTLSQNDTDNPFTLQLKATDFMTHPSWTVLTTMRKAPLASLLPLARRMGMVLPKGLQMQGAIDGVIGLSSSTGIDGGVAISDAVAEIPNMPPMRAKTANVTISGNQLHIEPAALESDAGGTLRAGGEMDLGGQNLAADISAERMPVAAFKQAIAAWFGLPDALMLLAAGDLNGHFRVSYSAVAQKPVWSGQLQLTDITLNIPEVSVPVQLAQGRATFDETTFDLPRMSGTVGDISFNGSYHYSSGAKHPERLRLDFAKADLAILETDLAASLSDEGLLSRLPFTRRSLPAWIVRRNLDGEVTISECTISQIPLGRFAARFIWQGANVQLSDVDATLPNGKMSGTGTISLASRLPHYRFSGRVDGYSWNGGMLRIVGSADSIGMGELVLQNLRARGDFNGEGITFAGNDAFDLLKGTFTLALRDTPALKLSDVTAVQKDQEWTGDGATDADGKLTVDLSNADRHLHLLGDLKGTQ